MKKIAFLCFLIVFFACLSNVRLEAEEAEENEQPLFDGKTLSGWKSSETQETWSVVDGTLVSSGPRSHLFYDGTVENHNFKNFELTLEYKLPKGCNSGLFFHTQFDEAGSPPKGYEIQISSSDKEDKKTGSLFAVRSVYQDFLPEETWTKLHLRVCGKHIKAEINDIPMIDYVEPVDAPRSRKGRILSGGTIALQAHDPATKVAFRNIMLKPLPDDAVDLADVVSDEKLARTIDEFGTKNIPVVDYHIHLRGGMTVEKAVASQAKTGIQSGVLENAGQNWPLSDNEKIENFITEAKKYPVFIGLQVNDRDWFKAIEPELLKKFDYILADTMIMQEESGKLQKLWLEEEYTIDNPEKWMEKYFQHCMTIVNEPINILANPTYLPKKIAPLYDTLWTTNRMTELIDAAVKNGVAFEIQAGSDFPNEKFIKLAKSKGAKFTLGRNNFDDKPIDMQKCFDAMKKYDFKTKDIFLPKH